MRNMPPRLISYSILQDARDANVIYLGTNLGVYRSLDRGASWAPVWAVVEPIVTPTKGKKKAAAGAMPATQPVPLKVNETVRRAQEALNAAGYRVGVADGLAGTQTLSALKKYQADRQLPVSGKFDDATLRLLGVPAGADSAADLIVLSDAVNALVQTVDMDTRQPLFLAATNLGLFRSLDPTTGWQRRPLVPAWIREPVALPPVPSIRKPFL